MILIPGTSGKHDRYRLTGFREVRACCHQEPTESHTGKEVIARRADINGDEWGPAGDGWCV
jgi:hypothetical protein